jgi:hypothetical protein
VVTHPTWHARHFTSEPFPHRNASGALIFTHISGRRIPCAKVDHRGCGLHSRCFPMPMPGLLRYDNVPLLQVSARLPVSSQERPICWSFCLRCPVGSRLPGYGPVRSTYRAHYETDVNVMMRMWQNMLKIRCTWVIVKESGVVGRRTMV